MAIDGRVSILASSFVCPATPTSRHSLLVPFHDVLWMNAHYNQSLLFYHVEMGIDYPSLLSKLRQSLSVVLDHFYMWAGRLAKLEDETIVIDCNDAGVEFLEAVCPDIPFDLLEKSEFQQQPLLFSKLVPLGDKKLIHDLNLPLLSVQITRFVDGGVAIGFASSHVLCDGISFWMFMASWAECGRGVPISTPPVHMRSVVQHPRILENGKYEGGPDKHNVGTTLVERVFHFRPELIKKLKEVGTENGKGHYYSTFECVCAHMWRRITAARGVGEEQKLRLSMLANTRRRLVPQLPDAYFGNAIFPIRLFSTACELRKETLATTIRRIHEEIISCDDAAIKAFEQLIKKLLPDGAFEPETDVIGTTAVGSPKFPAYELDFGFGRPAAVRVARMREEGVMMLFAGREGGGSVDVTIALPSQVMEKLEAEADTEFIQVQ